MNARTRTITTLAVTAVALLGTTGCSGSEHTEQTSFPFHGTVLEVTNSNNSMPVSVDAGPAGTVSVQVSTTTAGKDAVTPAWALSGNALDLGSPCTKGYVGLCEGSYTVTVPQGTTVRINGQVTPVG